MVQEQNIIDRVDTLEQLLATRLGARRGSLARRVAKAGRALPSGIRRDLEVVIETAQMMQHPKLALRIDQAQASSAATRAEDYLRGIDARDRRKGRVLGILGALVFNLLLVAVFLLVLLRWRGFV